MPSAASPRFVTLPDRAILRLSGDDRAGFLQGLVTNDVAKIGPERAIHASFLTAQGKYLHDFFLVDAGDAILIEGARDRLPDLKRRLGLYKLRAKIALEESFEAFEVRAAYPDSGAAHFGLNEAGAAKAIDGGFAFADPRHAGLGARLIVTPDAPATLPAGSIEEYDRLRIGLGVPDGARDLIQDKSILLENGFDELNGVDWKKGCYIGQELTARTKYRGLIKKRLLPVEIDGPIPAPGTPVLLGDQEAGEMRGAVPGLGLALLRLEMVEAAIAQGGRLVAGETALTPRRPEWLKS
jgi:folate-binding protein YgfZ